MSMVAGCTGFCNGRGCGMSVCPGNTTHYTFPISDVSVNQIPQGWQCPFCGNVYGPSVQKCWNTHPVPPPVPLVPPQ